MYTESTTIRKTGWDKLSIIIPVYNEEKHISALLYRLHRSLTKEESFYLYEIIVVDDNSTDSSVEVLKRLSSKYPIKIFKKQGVRGKAQSLKEGFSQARYENVAFIDADLQYPPEALPEMLDLLATGYDVVVANRKKRNSTFARKLMSHAFRSFFGKFLHGFDVDVQSGMKVFKKEIIERIVVNSKGWAFDIEFLFKARNAGYRIGSYDIMFEKRKGDASKINIPVAVWELAWTSLKLKFGRSEAVPFHPKAIKKYGDGFHYKGVGFVHHSKLPFFETAFQTIQTHQKLFLILLIELLLFGLAINSLVTIIVLMTVLTVLYFGDLLFNLFVIFRGFILEPEIEVSEDQLKRRNRKEWPMYTILCPLYNEWQVVHQYVEAMSALDYPKDRLQVIVVLEEDDTNTIAHIKDQKLPKYFETVIVPNSFPKTKPKALNYAMRYARGEFVVVYDAEDIPDPKQLKKVVIAFENSKENVICVQAKLNYYNPHQNLLTRIFTAEYSLWFDLILTGYQSLNTPIPLGGTSNHFRTKDIDLLKGWDSFNVTEDCDLGIRLTKMGYRTSIINSVTMEEANSDLMNWFNQRSRWIKGYIQTYLVHMRNVKSTRQKLQKHFATFQLIVGGKILSLFINPFMWAITIAYFALRPFIGTTIEKFFPGPVFYMAVFCLVVGNFIYLYFYMIAVVKRKQYDLVKYAFLVPFYWIAMSIAAWKALYQLFSKPHFWPKTVHGLHLDKKIVEKAKMKLADNRLLTYPVNLKPAYAAAEKAELETWSKKNISSGTILVGAMMAGNFLNFLFNAYLGRAVSFEDFGLLTLINTFLYVVGVFASGLRNTVNHRVAFLSSNQGEDAASGFFVKAVQKFAKYAIGAAFFWIVISPFLVKFFHIDDFIPLLLFAPVIFFTLTESIVNGYLTGSFAFISIAVIMIMTALFKFLAAVFLVQMKLDDITYFSIIISVTVMFTTSISLGLKKVLAKKISKNVLYSFPKKFFTASIINGFATTAFLSIDILLAKHFLSPYAAGEYAFLSLVGKMIYYFGSLFNIFMTPMISKDMGANKDPKKNFYRLLSLTTMLTFAMYIGIGILGKHFLPILFGSKVFVILPYLPSYALAISLIVICNSIISYHLIRHHYTFPIVSFLMSFIMIIGISLFHHTIFDITHVMLATSIISFILLILLHLLQRNEKFFLSNLVDLIGLFIPIPKTVPRTIEGKHIMIYNWRDTRHKFAGGAEVYIHELAKRWVKEGNSVTLFCGNDGNAPRNEVIDGVQIIRRGGFYFVYLWAFLYHMFRFRNQYDVIVDSENGIPFFTPVYAKGKKILLIHHVHQEVFRKSLIAPLAWIASFLEIRLMPFIYKNIEVMTVSPSSKKEIMEKGLSTKEPHIIYNGIDLSKYKPGKKNKDPLVLYVGRLKRYKSIHILIKAAEQLVKELPKIQFVIAGDGEEKDKLMNMVRKAGLESKITFTGMVTEKEKVALYQKAWVFVNPSMMEGWGITSIEASACGVPVVASNVAGLRDSVRNPHTGYLVKYGDSKAFAEKIKKLIKDNKLRTKMSEYGVVWAKNFTWTVSAKESLKIIK